MKLPVFKAVAMTFAFLGAHLLDLVRIVWLPMALMLVLMAVVMPGYMQTIMGASTADPAAASEEAMAAFSASAPVLLLLFVVSIAFYLVLFAGVLKLVLHGENPKLPFYAGFGGDEFRLLGTWVLQLLIFIGAYIGIALVGGAAAFLAVSSPMLGGIAALVVIIVGMVAFCWLMLRLSLATPATIGQRTIGLGPSWNVAKGNVWRLLGYWLIWGIVFMVIEIVMIALLMPGYFEAMGDIFTAAGSGSPEGVEAATQKMNDAMMSMYAGTPGSIASQAGGLILGTAAIVMMAVAGGVAWRLMTDTSPEKHFE
ncbi:MAG TPA: hypothetical protein VGO52_25590 [Hyphomonadaceae bacterium]|jgi:hypothetical protein|nr:hypothetical protein [Hyphomonadaceae bacterium]